MPPRILSKNENITRTKYSKQILYATVGGSIITVKGMSIIITCPVAGAPYPVVKWSKANSSFVIDPRIYVTFDSHFRMNNVRVSDSGRYTCTATNKVGEMNRSTYLLVAGRLNILLFTECCHSYIENFSKKTDFSVYLRSGLGEFLTIFASYFSYVYGHENLRHFFSLCILKFFKCN